MTYQGLVTVEFGHIAAEEEAVALQRYFVETREYSELLSTSKLLVIGRKGSGKSAIYVAIRDMNSIFQQDISQKKAEETTQLTELHQLLTQYFNEEELQTLAFQLGVRYDSLLTEGKTNKARELVLYMERRNRIPELLDQCREARPNINWAEPRQREIREYDLPKIRQVLDSQFSLEDLKTLCFDLRISYEDLSGDTIRHKTTALVDYCQRRALLPELIEVIHNQQPTITIQELYLSRPTIDTTQTGQSATTKQRPETNAIIEALTLQDYPWEIHKQIKDAGVPIELSYVNSWKYVIWVLLAKKLLSFDEPARFKIVDSIFWKSLFNANLRFLRRFLKQNYGSVAPSFSEIFADRARQIRSIKVKDFEVGADTSENKSQRLSRSISIINRALESRILAVLPNDKEYYLLFDQLDLGWDETEETKQLLIGLIMASRDVIRVSRKAQKQVRIVIFLRSDIYESLRFEDKNKVWHGDTVKLRWDEWRLKELITRRIEASADGTWEDAFSGEGIQGRLQLSYIVERTMLRPRDMIQFCSYAREAALRLGKDKIDNHSILEACKAYSDYMRREIQDECKASFPEVDKLLAVLKDIGSKKITRQQFFERCKTRKIQNEELVLQRLVDFSVLGVCRHARTDYRYQVDHWETLEPTRELMIHPSLEGILGITNDSPS